MVTIGAIAVITGVIIVDHHAHEQVERQIPLARIEAQMHELKFLQEQAETQHELSASFEQDVENVRRNLAEALQELGAHTSDTQAQQVHRSILSYENNMVTLLELLAAHNEEEAERWDAQSVDPSYGQAMKGIAELRIFLEATAERADLLSHIGSGSIILLAVLGGVALFRSTTRAQRKADRAVAEQQALSRSEARFRALVQHASDLITVVGMDGKPRYISPSSAYFTGYAMDMPFEDASPIDYMHPDDMHRFQEAFFRCAQQPGSLPPFEVRYRHADGSWRWTETIATNALHDPSIGGIIFNTRDIDDRKQVEQELRDRLALEALVTTISSTFITMPPDQIEAGINNALQQIGSFTGVDRSYIFLLSPDGTTMSNTHGWCADGINSQIGVLQDIPTALVPWSMEQLHDHQPIYIPCVGDMPAIARPEQELLKAHSIQSVIAIPLTIGQALIGFAGFDSVRAVKTWKTEDIALLKMVGEIFANALNHKWAQEALHYSEAQFRTLFEGAALGIALANAEGQLITTNPALGEMLGYSIDELQALALTEITHPDDIALDLQHFQELLAGSRTYYSLEKRYIRKDGRIMWGQLTVSLVAGTDTRMPLAIGMVEDITNRKALAQQLQHQAFHDSLTGLPNRALFMDRLQQALGRRERHASQVGVLFMDLDNFKLINDSLGHEVGDQVLHAVSELLRRFLRPDDTAARFGGDEFVIMLEELATEEEALVVAERILAAFQTPLTIADRAIYINASIGIALAQTSHEQAANLLRYADFAMYRAKQRGKGQAEVFDHSMNAHLLERVQLEMDLRRALEHKEFHLVYQPIIDLESGQLHNIEALIRWHHPQRGLVSPATFIPIAEESGLIVALGRWVLEEACRQARAWQEIGGVPISISVNLSAKQFQQQGLVSDIVAILRSVDLDPACLKLEITESVLMEDTTAIAKTLQQLNAAGIQFALDDFGTGYSSLAYLQQFPMHYLKIDRSFINRLAHDPENAAIVRAIVSLAHTLNVATVAEGVETEEQAHLLRTLRCDYGQGYLFAKPLPPDAVLDWLAAPVGS